MENKYLFSVLEKYFNTLTKTGYIQDNIVMQIMMLLIIDEIKLNFESFMSKEDGLILQDALECLYNSSCFIGSPIYNVIIPIDEVGKDLCEYN